MSVDDASHDCETQTSPRSGPARIGLPESIESSLRIFLSHAGSCVLYFQHRAFSFFQDSDLDLGLRRCVPYRIRDQVDGHLTQTSLITLDDDLVGSRDGDFPRRTRYEDVCDHFANDALQVNGLILKWSALIKSGQEEKVLHEPAHLATRDPNAMNGFVAHFSASQLTSTP